VKLVSLSLRQWRTFEECDLEFPDGLIGVRGQNGAGKTTIAEAIGWALFGKLRAGAKVSGLRRQGAPAGTSSSVELIFRIGPTLFRVHRLVGGTAKLWIGDSEQPETTQTRSTNARIALELDLTWDVFQRTVFARQKDVAALDPSGSADARRRHVERLLGLERYRLAAEKARSDARTIRDELTGRRAQAPDLKEVDTQLKLAEEQAAKNDPEVEKAQARCDAATKLHNDLVVAADAEMERANRHVELVGVRDAQKQIADQAEADVATLGQASAARIQKVERHAKISKEAASCPQAATTLDLWNDLAGGSQELAEALAALEAVGYQPRSDETDSERLAALVAENESLAGKAEALRLASESLGRRLVALRAVERAGSVQERRKLLRVAQRESATTSERLGVVQHELENDRTHVAAVTEGGSETPCPVCLRPYGAEHESILATYNTRIEGRTEEARLLSDHVVGLQPAIDSAEEALRAAELAAAQLEASDGSDDTKKVEDELAATNNELTSTLLRREQIEAELPPLQANVATHSRAREDWRAQDAVRAEREARSQRLRERLGVKAYAPEAHERARALAERLTSVSTEFDALAHELEATKDVDERLATVKARASEARALEAGARTSLEELAFVQDKLEALRAQRDTALQAYQDSTKALTEARTGAQAGSENVRSLRAQLEQAQAAHEEIQARSVELERHETAARLLTEFRARQSQRAWPHLEQGASAILSAATDGRYADVRLSDDYRVVVVDRGEEHELARFSGGEQDITNLCLRIAIAEWVAREREAEINFMVLDEVFGSQDDERRHLLLSELRALGNRFHQLLVITHVGEIADLCEHHVQVTLEETGRSTAVFVE
jgi:exonuclease SbcC